MCFCCNTCLSDLCLIILSILFPPLPVWIRRGICSGDSLINILLCILGYFPGLIHAWYIIAKYPPYSGTHESQVYYVYLTPRDLERQQETHHHHHHHHTSNVTSEPLHNPTTSYGATNETRNPPPYTEVDGGKLV